MDNVCDKLAQLSIPRFSTCVARCIGINLSEIIAQPADKKLPRDLFQNASFMVLSWMYMGFHSSAQMLDKVQGLHVVLATWIPPWCSNKCRPNTEVWNAFNSTSIVLALHRMVTGRSTRHRFSVMARACAPQVQEALLQRNFEPQSWRDYCITRACSPNCFDMPVSSDVEDTFLLEVTIQLHMSVTSAMQVLCVCCWASVAAAGVLCARLSMFTIAHPILVTCSILLFSTVGSWQPLRMRSFASEATCRVGDKSCTEGQII